MTDDISSLPIVDKFRSKFEETSWSKFKRIIIVSSFHPYSVVSTAFLCKVFLRKAMLFHVTFANPIIDGATLEHYTKNADDTLIIGVGIDVVGVPKQMSHLLLLAGTAYSTVKKAIQDNECHPVAAEALALACSLDEISSNEKTLAAISSLLQEDCKEALDGIITVAREEGLITLRKGFRIPGYNFLPLKEVFVNNIHPYLKGISGNEMKCEELFDLANIRFDKLGTPLSKLTPIESTQLNSLLLPTVPQHAIEQILGDDLEIVHIPQSSPLRRISGINPLLHVAWGRQILGAALSTLLGDRARAQSDLVSEYRTHCKEVISQVTKMNDLLSKQDDRLLTGEKHITIEMDNLNTLVLPEVGRILLSSYITPERKFILFVSNEGIDIVWQGNLPLRIVSAILMQNEIRHTTTSPYSLRLLDSSEGSRAQITEVLESLLE